ncbi:MAG: N-acetylmuramoyl-L-alanine amidase [Candidatus Limnocylindria bacterium]
MTLPGHRRFRLPACLLAIMLLATACGDAQPPVLPSPSVPVAPPAAAAPTPATGDVLPAPGSDSAVYGPNPGAVVVAIDPGHGGCLDWGVPDPQQRGEEFSEKAINLAIAEALRARLEAEGVTVVILREGDVALAGDLYPELGCQGEPWRDVNGDGVAGFGPDVPEATRTRDELQARLDLANLARADALISIHVDSIADAAGNLLPIARTETFYTDETPWGASETERLAAELQAAVVSSMAAVAGYDRQDRGLRAHNLYIVAPPLFETTPERDDPLRQPTRGALMPTVLVEVGSITLPAEHELLLTADGVNAAAVGLFDGLAAYFAERQLAARIEPVPVDGPPDQVPGDGPPFWPGVLADQAVAPFVVRVVNTGQQDWPSDLRLLAGWEAAEEPYLAAPPSTLAPLDVDVPALGPGESVELRIRLEEPLGGARHVAWITLADGDRTLADLGSPALQLGTQAP